MPFPDSNYPRILLVQDKRESQRLLAAAPAMLAALKELVRDPYDAWDDPEQGVIGDARLAIAKAEGRNDE
jgi:hypothetical protein